MKNVFLLSGIFIYFLTSAQQVNTKAVGVIDDSYQVNAAGAFNHIIPIQVPPGVHGMVPNISIVYDSRSGISSLGYGWALSGLSKITRTGNNVAQHGQASNISFTNKDAFLLDGQYLSCVEGANGNANSVYHTENESFSIIRAIGNIDRSTASPKYFIVKQPNGLTYYYGFTSDSRLNINLPDNSSEVLEWHLSSIVDQFDNYIEFEYKQLPSNSVRLESISYTGNEKQHLQPVNKLLFNYVEDQAGKRKLNTQFISGASIKDDNTLLSISISNSGRTFKTYSFSYDATNQYLQSVKECNNGDGSCLPATTISWSLPDTSKTFLKKTIKLPDAISASQQLRDMNGDGKPEFFKLSTSPAKDSFILEVFVNKSDRFERRYRKAFPKAGIYEYIDVNKVIIADFNGDFLPDIKLNDHYLLNNSIKDSFDFSTEKQAYALFSYPVYEPLKTVDINGDGNEEIVESSYMDLRISGFIGNKLDSFFTLTASNMVTGSKAYHFIDHFSGPIKSDILVLVKHENRIRSGLLKMAGKEIESQEVIVPSEIQEADLDYLQFRDINGDGIADMILARPNAYLHIWIFDGKSFVNSYPFVSPFIRTNQKMRYGNFTSSGFLQCLVVSPDNKFQLFNIYVPDKTQLEFQPVTANTLIPSNIKLFDDFDKIQLTDSNNDGVIDLMINQPASKELQVFEYPLNFINKVNEIKDGFGNIVHITYADINDTLAYSCSNDPLKSNYFYYSGPYTIVKELNYTRGSSALPNRTTRYFYKDLSFEKTGRGIAGFGHVEELDPKLGLRTITKYEYEFPLTGKILSQQKINAKGYLLYKQTNEWAFKIYKQGTEFKEINLTAATNLLINKLNSPGVIGSIKNMDSSALSGISLLSTLPQGVNYNALTEDLINNQHGFFSGKSTLKLISKFNESRITYLPVLMNTRVIKKSDENKTVSNISLDYSYNMFGQTVSLSTHMDDGTVHVQEKTYANFNDDLSPAATYILGLLNTESNYVYKIHSTDRTPPRVIRYEYDQANGSLRKMIRQPGSPEYELTTAYTYNAFGNLLSLEKYRSPSDKSIESYMYTSDERFVAGITNPLGYKSRFEYDKRMGYKLSETDPNGFSIRYTYDDFGNILSELYPDGKKIEYRYEYLDSTELTLPGKPLYKITLFQPCTQPLIKYYNKAGREVISVDKLLADSRHINNETYEKRVAQFNEYDDDNRLVFQSIPTWVDCKVINTNYKLGLPPVLLSSLKGRKYNYDETGRLVSVQLPGSGKLQTVYKSKERIDYSLAGTRKTYNYNSTGAVNIVTDEQGNRIYYLYDLWGNLTRITYGNGQTITTTYDLLGRKIKMEDPNMGIVQYNYDEFDRLVSEVTNNTKTITIVYDKINRIVRKTTPEGVYTWEYDKDVKGKLSKMTDANGNTKTKTYDQLARLVQEESKIDSVLYTVRYGYDSLSRLASKTFPSGYSLLYEYSNNIVVRVSERTAPNKPLRSIWKLDDVNAMGLMTSKTLGNGVRVIHDYDSANGQLRSIKSWDPALLKDLQNLEFSYDDYYELKKKEDLVRKTTESYTYDPLRRLIKWQRTVANRTDSVSYAYNDYGNIISKTGTGIYQYSAVSKQRVTAIRKGSGQPAYDLVYDQYGNISEDRVSGLRITYTSFNKPVLLQKGDWTAKITYGFEGAETGSTYRDGQAVLKKTIKPFSDYEIITEKDKTSYTHYIAVAGQLVAIHTLNDSANFRVHKNQYIHSDNLNSVTLITNDSAASVGSFSYSSFGERTVEGSNVFKYGYTGHGEVDQFGLINAGGRFYMPAIGRFISPDPFVQDPTDLQCLNRYSYVQNDPINRTDPNGFWSISKPTDFSNETKALSRGIKNIGREVTNGVNKVVELHQNIYNEGDRFVDKYGKQILIVTTAAAITVASGGSLSGLVAPMAYGALIGAGVSAGITAYRGGSFQEVLSASFSGAINGAASGAMFGAIGDAFTGVNTSFGSSGYFAQTLAHGTAGGIQSEIGGGTFQQGFISTAIVNALTPVNESLLGNSADLKFARIAFAGAVGGTAAYASGGNVAMGIANGVYSRWFNHENHLEQKAWVQGSAKQEPYMSAEEMDRYPEVKFERAYSQGFKDAFLYLFEKFGYGVFFPPSYNTGFPNGFGPVMDDDFYQSIGTRPTPNNQL